MVGCVSVCVCVCCRMSLIITVSGEAKLKMVCQVGFSSIILYVHMSLNNCTVGGWSDAEREHVGQEMSDILIYLVRLAEVCKVDLPSAVAKKFALNAEKYPVDKAYGSMKKYTAYQNPH